MLTLEERRENALKHFTSTYGPDRGVKRWETYCRKMGWLEEEVIEIDDDGVVHAAADPKPKGARSSARGRAGK